MGFDWREKDLIWRILWDLSFFPLFFFFFKSHALRGLRRRVKRDEGGAGDKTRPAGAERGATCWWLGRPVSSDTS